MKNELYLESGYLNVDHIMSLDYPFTFIIGARGVGKTYGVLEYIYENKEKYIHLRRTQVQADLLSSSAFQPYKQLCADKGWNIGVNSVAKNVSGIAEIEDDVFKDNFGYICALSTFSNLRGFDASDVNIIFYDEFIPETTAKPIRSEYETLLNVYETVNRNRELKGCKPVKLICCANSNTIDNPYFIGLGVINKIASMQSKGRMIYKDDSRGLLIINLSKSPISQKKKNTALYRLSDNTDFGQMALENLYAGTDMSTISRERLIEYKPKVNVGEITIYVHKSKRVYYATTHKSGTPVAFSTSTDDLERYRNAYRKIFMCAYYEDRFLFEDAVSQVLFKRYTF